MIGCEGGNTSGTEFVVVPFTNRKHSRGNTGGGGGVTDLVMSSYVKLSMDQATGLVQSKMQAKESNMAVTVT